jgi:hypothetical protein
MATTPQSSTAAKTRSSAAPRRKPAPRRSTAKPPAARRTTSAASSTTARRRPRSRVEHVQQLAERAVLIPVGAALEARDLAVTYRSRSAVEAQLTRFERRGGKARRQARTRLEREVRRTRSRIGRQARRARRNLDRQRAQLRRNLPVDVEELSNRVENVVQGGVDLGMKLVNGAQDRFTKAA